AAPPDVGPGQQRAVEQGAQAVVRQHRGARHLGEEPAPEGALDRSPGVVRSQAEEERRARAVLLEQLNEPRHALARPVVGVDVDLERELHSRIRSTTHSTSRAASATWVRYASKISLSASRMPTFGFQPRSFIVPAIRGTRLCTSW